MDVTLKKLVLAGIGAASLTKEKVEELVDELVKRGEVSEEEKAKFIKETAAKVEEHSKQLRTWVDEAVSKATERLKPKFQKDIEELSAQVQAMRSEIAELRKELAAMKKA
ncbi:MAG: phasin family protein [candidate division KSB1 bacterium]|nr:phasin family protein [candidate division KSB1 bacterium]